MATPMAKLFDGAGKGNAIRDRLISNAVNEHGDSQMEVARPLQLHYSTISRLSKRVNEEQRKTSPQMRRVVSHTLLVMFQVDQALSRVSS